MPIESIADLVPNRKPSALSEKSTARSNEEQNLDVEIHTPPIPVS